MWFPNRFFFSKTNPKMDRVIIAFFQFLRRWVDEKHLIRFQVFSEWAPWKTPFSNSYWVVWTRLYTKTPTLETWKMFYCSGVRLLFPNRRVRKKNEGGGGENKRKPSEKESDLLSRKKGWLDRGIFIPFLKVAINPHITRSSWHALPLSHKTHFYFRK